MKNNNQPLSEKKSATLNSGCLTLFCSIFLIIGIFFAWQIFILPVSKMIFSLRWQETSCTIISSEVHENSDSDGNTYKVDIKYKYKFNNVEYQSNQYNFMNMHSSGYKGKAKVVKEYYPNRVAVCYVNPNAPTEAVINRQPTTELVFGVIPLVFVVIGLGGVGFGIRSLFNPNPSSLTQPQQISIPENVSFNKEFSKENIPLNPAVSPLQKVLGVGIFCLFWNAVVGIMIFEFFNSGGAGLLIALIPFGLIGLWLLREVIKHIKAMYSPKPEFFINRATTPLGGKLKLSWVISGNPLDFNNMSIALQGFEESKYTRGTDTYTDKEIFYEKELLNTSNLSDIFKSDILIDIPNSGVPSFQGENNKIVWCISVKAIIEGWANFEETYNLTVTSQVKNY